MHVMGDFLSIRTPNFEHQLFMSCCLSCKCSLRARLACITQEKSVRSKHFTTVPAENNQTHDNFQTPQQRFSDGWERHDCCQSLWYCTTYSTNVFSPASLHSEVQFFHEWFAVCDSWSVQCARCKWMICSVRDAHETFQQNVAEKAQWSFWWGAIFILNRGRHKKKSETIVDDKLLQPRRITLRWFYSSKHHAGEACRICVSCSAARFLMTWILMLTAWQRQPKPEYEERLWNTGSEL